jgi:hypothetical protein
MPKAQMPPLMANNYRCLDTEGLLNFQLTPCLDLLFNYEEEQNG